MSDKIFGYEWDHIQRIQQGGASSGPGLDLTTPGDYGSDPLENGMFRMVPSGDVVDMHERNRRMAARSRAGGAA